MLKAMLVDNNRLMTLELETKNIRVGAIGIRVDFYAKNHSKTLVPDQLFLYHNDRMFRALNLAEERVIRNGDSITVNFLVPWTEIPTKRIN